MLPQGAEQAGDGNLVSVDTTHLTWPAERQGLAVGPSCSYPWPRGLRTQWDLPAQAAGKADLPARKDFTVSVNIGTQRRSFHIEVQLWGEQRTH